MSKLYLIQGFLGAGKTTFARRLSEQTGAVVLNPDESCMAFYPPQEYEREWNRCFEQTVERLWEEARQCLEAGQDVIFDMGFWSRGSRDEARDKAQKWGAECILYYLYAPDEILRQRLALRKGKVAEDNQRNFFRLKELFEEPGEDENAIRIDHF